MTEITFRSDMKVELIQHMGTDETQVHAAKASTGTDQAPVGKIKGLIGYLFRERHTSPSEHQHVSVRVEVPLFVRSEWQRHRTQSYSELSMRFSEAAPQFYVIADERPVVNNGNGAHPELVPGTPGQVAVAQIAQKRVAEVAWEEYQCQIEAGIANEVARNVLPVETYTTFWATANLNNWFKFLDLRNGEVGKPLAEIVDAAQQVEAIIAELYPVAYKAWKRHRRIMNILMKFYPQAETEYKEIYGDDA
jgi:thymidylate synthase (FAD)